MTRLPVGPLVRLAELAFGADTGRALPVTTLCSAAGVSTETWRKAVRAGGLTVGTADRLAVLGLGVHPVEVWGDDWLLPADVARARFAGRVHELFERMKENR